MNKKNIVLIITLLLSFSHFTYANQKPSFTTTYKIFVDDKGNISLPEDFNKNWVFLGAWSVAQSNKDAKGAAALHNVYTQADTVEYFKKNKKFPDGAILIKELFKNTTKTMTTGTVSFANEVEGWFVMVKDSKVRFKSNPLWGDGWGWVLFNATDKTKTVTKNYKIDCLGCHIPAKSNDWIYTEGYPILFEDKMH